MCTWPLKLATAAAAAALLLTFHGAGTHAGPAADRAPVIVQKNELATSRGKEKAASLVKRAEERGRVRVIVGLDAKIEFEDDVPPAEQRRQSQALRKAQGAVAARAGIAADRVKRLEAIPYMSGAVTPAQLKRLLRDPEVMSIQEDVPIELQLNDSLKLIKAKKVWNTEGSVGNGVVIAVLDSGAEYSHPMLKGKVVAGLCRSTTDASEGTTSLDRKSVV